jgi:hypothetical protein
MKERTWTIIAGLLLIVAAVFLLRDNINVAFVAATLGLVAWFLGLRDRLRKNIVAGSSDQAQGENKASGDQDEA